MAQAVNESGEEETFAARPTISINISWDDSLSISAKKKSFPVEIKLFAKVTSTVLACLESRRKNECEPLWEIKANR